MGNIVTIDFHGDRLLGIETERGIFVALKPIVEGMGLAWNKQLERVKRDPILSEGMTVMVIPSEGGSQETACLRLDLVHGWLFTVDALRVKADVRVAVLTYKRECYAALSRAFAKSREPHSEPPPARPIAEMPPGDARKLVDCAYRVFGSVTAREVWFATGLIQTPSMLAGPRQLVLFPHEFQQGGR